jgi:hypothetical protein
MASKAGSISYSISVRSVQTLDDYERAKNELPNIARSLVEGAGREIECVLLTSPADAYVPHAA